ncbi:LemA protein [Rhodococcus sp. SMB37]|uniref:LemA family protein n=1 Tax=Rhodococcus sp. SMB37 TaxID=2512213 RepID=UPI000B067905|nr:LemA family protein [Rhodococcus sp. SMB37]TCN49251.1 LemA protein [Rhodococcus sp. SMB37]
MTPVALVIVVAVVAVALLWIRLGMRRLRTLRTRRRDGLHLLLNELDDRYDLIPALIAASAGAGVERSRISPVVGARSLAIAMRDQRLDLPERAATENALSAALHELIGVLDGVNHWPFIRVARELQTREQRIAGAVRVHNDLADKLNSQVSSFPTSLFAKLAGVRAVAVFEVPAGLATETVTETTPVTEQQTEAQAPTSDKTDEKDSGTVAA